MSEELNAEQRGDMVEALMPEAAGLVVDVHEGSADDIRTRLAGLTRHELEALAVVLAALADPDQPLKDALSWVDFDEHGDHVAPSRRSRTEKTVRALAPEVRRDLAGIDVVAVNRALSADNRGGVVLTPQERRLAVEVGNRRGYPKELIAERLGMTRGAVDRSWQRIRERAREEGVEVPARPSHSLAVVA